jgi:hypothetical protein
LDASGVVGGFGDPEVGELDLASVAEQHARGRHIAMNDTGGVSIIVRRVRKVERCSDRVREIRRQATRS